MQSSAARKRMEFTRIARSDLASAIRTRTANGTHTLDAFSGLKYPLTGIASLKQRLQSALSPRSSAGRFTACGVRTKRLPLC